MEEIQFSTCGRDFDSVMPLEINGDIGHLSGRSQNTLPAPIPHSLPTPSLQKGPSFSLNSRVTLCSILERKRQT